MRASQEIKGAEYAPDPEETCSLRSRAETADRGSIARLSREWHSLAMEDACSEPFFQPEWFDAFARFFEPRSRFLIFSAWRNCELRGVLPMIRTPAFLKGIPARTLRSLSGIHSCRFDLIHGADDSYEASRKIWEQLKSDDEWEVIEALDVPEGGAFENILACAENEGFYTGIWPTRRSPFLPLSPESRNPYLHCPEKTKGVRSRLKQYQKKLEKLGPVAFKVTTTAGDDVLHRFYSLEQSGWKGRAGSAIAQNSQQKEFYDQVARAATVRGAFRMYSLFCGDEVVAMEFGLLMSRRYYSPKAAYNEEFRTCSPGHLLVRHIIADLCSCEATKYDFLGPLAKYKCVWTPRVRAHNNLYIFRPGLKGLLLRALSLKAGSSLRKLKYRIWGDPQDISRGPAG